MHVTLNTFNDWLWLVIIPPVVTMRIGYELGKWIGRREAK